MKAATGVSVRSSILSRKWNLTGRQSSGKSTTLIASKDKKAAVQASTCSEGEGMGNEWEALTHELLRKLNGKDGNHAHLHLEHANQNF